MSILTCSVARRDGAGNVHWEVATMAFNDPGELASFRSWCAERVDQVDNIYVTEPCNLTARSARELVRELLETTPT